VQQPSHVFQPQVVEQSIRGKTAIGQIDLEKLFLESKINKKNSGYKFDMS
jgi:hypothetical protein